MTKSKRRITRRDAIALSAVCLTALPTMGCDEGKKKTTQPVADSADIEPTEAKSNTKKETTMRVQYLEVVTKDVDAACEIYSAIHGVTFGDADQNLGGARTATMKDGGMMGVRAPMHDGENPVTRAYMLVDDIEAAVAAAEKSGAMIAVPPMELPGHGTCAIYMLGGIEAGLWQN